MSDLATREEIKRNTDQDPDLTRLKDAYDDTINNNTSHTNQIGLNYDTRNNFWSNQNLETGRKSGLDAFPWPDASDIRPFTLDTIIREDQAMLAKGLLRGNLTAIGIEGNDIERSTMISEYMKWMLHNTEELERQAKILASFQEEKGIGIMGCFWDTKMEDQNQSISLEQIANINPENPNIGLELIALIQDKEQIKAATDVVLQFYPNIKRRKARKIVNDLRNNGEATIAVPTVIHNRPVLKALSTDEDIFFQNNVVDLQDAPYIFHAAPMTPEQLKSKVIEDGWDEKWVDDAIKIATGKDAKNIQGSNINRSAVRRFEDDNTVDVNAGYIRVINAYEKALTEDGVIGVFITTFHPDVEGWADSKLLDYKPSRYPFVAFPREYRSNRLMDTRGLPETAKGLQDEIKVQQDSRVDRTNLTTCPPREHPLGRKALNFGPADSIGVRRRGEYGYIETPSGNVTDSIEVEQAVRNSLNRMTGRPVAGEDPVHGINLLQDKMDQWLCNWVKVANQMWDLDQQFGDDEVFFRVIGSNDTQSMQFIRQEEQERVDFYFDFNLRNEDSDKHIPELISFAEAASKFDRQGTIDFDEILKAIAGKMDSSYVDRFVKPQAQATQEEIRKTQDDIAKMAAGLAVNAPENANTELRMQVIQQYLQGTEELPALDVQQRYQEDELFKARIDKYVEQLQFQDQQRENAITGTLGTQAGNGIPSA